MTETTTHCPHCGFDSEDDEMCPACGALFEEIPAPSPRETKAAAETTTCPHCGFESEDDEICQACGALFEDTPVRDISFAQVIGGIFSWLQDKGFHGMDEELDFNDDPANINIPGNIGYNLYHNDEP